MIDISISCFGVVAELVRRRTGLAFTWSRIDSAERATRRAMERLGHDDPEAYLRALETGRASLDALVSELTVHETYFFRDRAQFALLREVALPAIAAATGPAHTYRVWSAGCSSGEEAYSLAITLEEMGLADRSQVIGTDLCRGVLNQAHDGRYRSWSLRGVDDDIVRRYFRRVGDNFTIERRFRQRVLFETQNLVEASYPSLNSGLWGFDVIFCRNVLVYLERAAVRAIARRLFESLAVGGFLFTAASDPMLGDDSPFELIVTKSGIVYRRRELAGPRVAPLIDVRSPPQFETFEPHIEDPVTPPLVVVSAPPEEPIDPEDPLAGVRAAYAAGDWRHVTRAADDAPDSDLAALGVRAEANLGGTAEAARRCAIHLERHPLSIELHYLHALLLREIGHVTDAADAARRVVYLDPSLAAGHFVLGSILRGAGDAAGAARAYRNARDLAGARPPDELLPLGEGELAGALARAAAAELAGIAHGAEAR